MLYTLPYLTKLLPSVDGLFARETLIFINHGKVELSRGIKNPNLKICRCHCVSLCLWLELGTQKTLIKNKINCLGDGVGLPFGKLDKCRFSKISNFCFLVHFAYFMYVLTSFIFSVTSPFLNGLTRLLAIGPICKKQTFCANFKWRVCSEECPTSNRGGRQFKVYLQMLQQTNNQTNDTKNKRSNNRKTNKQQE